MSTITKYVVLCERVEAAGRVVPECSDKERKNGTPWGPVASVGRFDGWGIRAHSPSRERALKVAQRLKREGLKVRLERWVYAPGQQRARCFAEKVT